MPKFEVKKQAIDALLENLGVGKEPPDKNYNKPFGEKGTELESLHTDGVTIPTADFPIDEHRGLRETWFIPRFAYEF